MRLRSPYLAAAGFLLCAALTSCASSHAGGANPAPSPQSVGMAWDLTASSGKVLAINAIDGSCDDGPNVSLSETSSVVTVTVTTHPNGATSCDAVGHPKPLTLQLQAPLGTRTLAGCRPGAATPPDCKQIVH
jgi:hypothetical protein